MDNPLSNEAIVRNLQDAGCDHMQIQKFIQYLENQDIQKQLSFLKCHRCTLINEVHNVQKKIDCLDYLIYQLKKGECTYEK